MDNSQKRLKILLVCDNRAYSGNIKFRLEKSIETPSDVWHCQSIPEVLDMLNNKKLRADIIILDLGLVGTANPVSIYNEIGESALNIPIIVLTGTGAGEHELATFVMEAGAADHMVRGQFNRLMDAIEFSLIRHRIKSVAVAEALIEPSLHQKIIQDTHEEKIQDTKRKSDEMKNQHKQYISWMTGGYSKEESSD